MTAVKWLCLLVAAVLWAACPVLASPPEGWPDSVSVTSPTTTYDVPWLDEFELYALVNQADAWDVYLLPTPEGAWEVYGEGDWFRGILESDGAFSPSEFGDGWSVTVPEPGTGGVGLAGGFFLSGLLGRARRGSGEIAGASRLDRVVGVGR